MDDHHHHHHHHQLHHHTQGSMSPSYVPRKRKASQPKQKSGVPLPAIQRMSDMSVMSMIGAPPKNDDPHAQVTQKMKRTYGRKRYEDLQNVSLGSGVEDSTSETSCCSVVSSSLAVANGELPPPPPPSARLPHRLVAKDCWPNQAPDTGRAQGRGQEPPPPSDFAMKKMRRVEVDNGAPSVTNFPPEVRHTGGHVHSSHSIGGVAIQSSHSHPAEPSEEEKSKVFTFTTKKEPPVYPPGSQEERWQLMILGKGRVTCPKCKSVSRKTVEGLKKHMENCRVNPFTCQQCGKQLKSSTGMKYHIMADHNNLPSPDDINGLDDQSMKEKLRKVLKRMGKLKCSKEGCTGSFTSIMGYLYHMKKCGKEESELEKLLLNCQHCGKVYKSKAGLEYHLKSEHAPVPQNVEEDEVKAQREPNPERTPSGRVKRMSAQVAVFHLQEIANDELAKEWPKRKVIGDLVPDDKKLRYARPGLPAFSQEVLRKWKNEVKLQKKVQCPNLGCGSVYTSVSGLKAHLGLCGRGDFEAGKYKCLICKKEFNSESGVKYHINSVHSQDWFAVTSKSKNFKVLKAKTKENSTVDDPIVQHQTLHVFTPVLEPWQDMQMGPPPAVPEPALQANPEAAEAKRRGKGRGKEKDCYDFTGSDHSSSSSSGSSSSDSETEELDGQRHDVDQWALQRPSIIETHPDVAKQPRSNP
ncbi:zinc finger protein 512 isoform X3 [Oncorhynchus kisutch]|uniref:zinc finger protein 512 isoform X3 n=1 Tax=Oncorhynchus kisutch TaxID=8019 RepID=UPI0009A07C1F|nr:zinc finger protein 512-like isoform X3 [Oncorhynchus kisutch]XP_031656564.1 zinc finger protein 512-like isoform X3 [Oncorhynchus kisutch]